VDFSAKKALALTPYLKAKASEVVEQMDSTLFNHFVVYGSEGSGKMAFTEILAKSQSMEEKIVVVTLEETFDSKNLVGTYVCDELGSFTFKKGPLTVAAEQGMWLVLRDIDKSPSDLLSFLLPLVTQNRLAISSNQTLVPKLGFRLFALCKQDQRDIQALAPFLQNMTSVHLDPL
jgi:midasin